MLDVMRSNAKSSLIALIFGAIILTFIFSFGRGSSGFRTAPTPILTKGSPGFASS